MTGGNNAGATVAFVFIGGFLVFVFMYNLASTADEYLSPSLEHIVVRFGISESLAGVTFLAFGNGAPDVFSSIATASSAAAGDESKIDKTIGNNITAVSPLLGSLVFLTTVVISLVNLVSKPDRMTRVTPKFFLRDWGFLLGVVIYELVLLCVVG
jgi:sodium/potassium/calcium exchanger 6